MLLKHTLVKRVEFINEKIIEGSIELGVNLERNFKCLGDNENGFAELLLEIRDKNDDSPDAFRLLIKMHGIFSMENEKSVTDRMDELRDKAADIVYPYLAAYISAFIPLSGLPALFLPPTLQSFEKENDID